MPCQVILHPISDFISSNQIISHSSPSYYYQGHCPQTGELLKLPRTPMAEAIAYRFMQHLANQNGDAPEGKMYGILIVELSTGEQRVLKAFSGLLNGQSVVEGWVPPIPGRDEVALEETRTLAELDAIKQELITLKQCPQRQQYKTLSDKFEQQLQQMSDRHRASKHQRHQKRQQLHKTLTGEALNIALAQLEEESRQQGIERRHLKRHHNQVLQPIQQQIQAADTRIRELKQRRKALSRQLQAQMHAAYSLTNFSGESLTLQQLMPKGSIPTGTGDCCAPKLLHYAATQNLKPIAMAEFWWGSSSANGDKVQGEFYGACVERCQPLMGFLLSGLSHTQQEGKSQQSYPTHPDHTKPKQHLITPLEQQKMKPPLTPPEPQKAKQHLASPFLRGTGGGSVWGEVSEKLVLPIIYEDEWLIVVNKPVGLLSVPGRYRDTFDSVLTRLRHLLPNEIALTTVHRLDQDTSGILVLARDRQTHRQLSQQFQHRQVYKVYEAILSGLVTRQQGTIELPLWGNPENRPYQTVDEEQGKPSLTRFQVIAREGNYTRIEFIPLTGRTHQLRVHAADPKGLGIPILGDRLYGCHAITSRLHLHARELQFQHPQSGQILHLQIPVPF